MALISTADVCLNAVGHEKVFECLAAEKRPARAVEAQAGHPGVGEEVRVILLDFAAQQMIAFWV
ncbi:hypothetical protein D3C73_921660 [compost metagenome]